MLVFPQGSVWIEGSMCLYSRKVRSGSRSQGAEAKVDFANPEKRWKEAVEHLAYQQNEYGKWFKAAGMDFIKPVEATKASVEKNDCYIVNPDQAIEMIKKYVDIPILGIGAGGGIDGQLLIAHDVLGLYPNFVPRFAKNYFNIVIQNMIDRSKNKSFKKKQFTSLDIFQKAIELYVKETKNKTFPSDEYIYPIQEQELESIKTSKYWKE